MITIESMCFSLANRTLVLYKIGCLTNNVGEQKMLEFEGHL